MTPEEKVQKITDLLLARNLPPWKLLGAIDQVVKASEYKLIYDPEQAFWHFKEQEQ